MPFARLPVQHRKVLRFARKSIFRYRTSASAKNIRNIYCETSVVLRVYIYCIQYTLVNAFKTGDVDAQHFQVIVSDRVSCYTLFTVLSSRDKKKKQNMCTCVCRYKFPSLLYARRISRTYAFRNAQPPSAMRRREHLSRRSESDVGVERRNSCRCIPTSRRFFRDSPVEVFSCALFIYRGRVQFLFSTRADYLSRVCVAVNQKDLTMLVWK